MLTVSLFLLVRFLLARFFTLFLSVFRSVFFLSVVRSVELCLCERAATWLLSVVSICYLCFKCKRVICIYIYIYCCCVADYLLIYTRTTIEATCMICFCCCCCSVSLSRCRLFYFVSIIAHTRDAFARYISFVCLFFFIFLSLSLSL